MGKTELVLDGVDTMSIAPHKFYGLNGSGLLLKKKDLIIEPQIHGGASTTIYRSGTPALALAVSIEKSLRLTLENQKRQIAYVDSLNRRSTAAPAPRFIEAVLRRWRWQYLLKRRFVWRWRIRRNELLMQKR